MFIIRMYIRQSLSVTLCVSQRSVMQFESVKDAVMQFESTNFIYFFLRKFSGIFACVSYVTLIIF